MSNNSSHNPVIRVLAIIFIAIILIGVILVGVFSAKSSKEEKEKPTKQIYTIEESTEYQVSEYQAKQIATDYLMQNDYKLYYASNGNGISKIDMIEIATTEVEEVFTSYKVTLKGNYWGYDEYGNVKGKYNFDATVNVDSDGSASFGIVSHNKAY